MEEAEREMQSNMGKLQLNEEPKQAKIITGSPGLNSSGGGGSGSGPRQKEADLLDIGGGA